MAADANLRLANAELAARAASEPTSDASGSSAGVLRWSARWSGAWAGASAFVLALWSVGYALLLPEAARVDRAARRARARLGHAARPRRRGLCLAGRTSSAARSTPQRVSPHLRNAIVATEDRRFYCHFGVSPRGIVSADPHQPAPKGAGRSTGNGGSTITQQTAKLLCLGVPYDPAQWKTEADYEADCRRTTLVRKVKEALYAMAMEAKYSKDEILTIYLNRAYLGAGARGLRGRGAALFRQVRQRA